MKKFTPDPEYFKKSLYVLAVVVCAVTYYRAVVHLEFILSSLKGLMGSVRSILAPFIYGFAIAYLLNPVVRGLGKLIAKIKFFKSRQRARHIISTSVSFVGIIGLLVFMFSYMLPDISQSVTSIVASITAVAADPTNINLNFINDYLISINEITGLNYTDADIFGFVLDPLVDAMRNLPSALRQVYSGAMVAAGVALNIVLGIIIAFYMTLEKDNFKLFFQKLLQTVFKDKTSAKIIRVAADSNDMFERFFTGKALDSVVIGMLFFIIAQYILKLKYALFFSFIIGVTNMIPYFGPFIGGIPVALLVMLGDFSGGTWTGFAIGTGLWTGLAIFLLQQFDGNILGPMILGDRTGLKPMDVIFAILIGGAVAGVLGMFLGVPAFAILRTIIMGAIDKQYDKKHPPEGTSQ